MIDSENSKQKEAIRYESNKESVEQKREQANRSIALSLKTMGTGSHDKAQQ